MNQSRYALQPWSLQPEAGLQGFEGDLVADMAEPGTIEIESERIRRTCIGRGQPEDASLRIDEATDQPGAGQAVYPGRWRVAQVRPW